MKRIAFIIALLVTICHPVFADFPSFKIIKEMGKLSRPTEISDYMEEKGYVFQGRTDSYFTDGVECYSLAYGKNCKYNVDKGTVAWADYANWCLVKYSFGTRGKALNDVSFQSDNRQQWKSLMKKFVKEGFKYVNEETNADDITSIYKTDTARVEFVERSGGTYLILYYPNFY